MKCENCGSTDLAHGLDSAQCRNCGTLNLYGGGTREAGAGDAVAAVHAANNQPGLPTIVGNQADVQRWGADAAQTGDVVVPQDGIHPADNDAAQGLVTTETIRTGIHDESDLAAPALGTAQPEAQSVDRQFGSPVAVDPPAGGKDGDKAAAAQDKAATS